MKSKSQASIEFMSFVAILLVMLLIVASNSSSFTANMINSRVYTEGKKMSDTIAFEINTAVKAGDGYRRSFFVGNDIFGITNFVVATGSYTVVVDWKSGFASTPIVISGLQGNITKNSWNTISNSGGIIYVS